MAIRALGYGSLQLSPGYTGMMSKANCSVIVTTTYTYAKATEIPNDTVLLASRSQVDLR